MKKILFLSLFVLAQAAPVQAAPIQATPVHVTPLRVSASHYPLAFFAAQTLGETAEVGQLTPAGAEPHEYRPGPRDMIRLNRSQLVIYHGASMEPWIERQRSQLTKHGSRLLRLEGFFGQESAGNEAHGENPQPDQHLGHDHHHNSHETNAYDPHFWLDPIQAQALVRQIAAEASQIAPAREGQIQAQAQGVIARLEQLHQAFKKGLKSCKSRLLVSEHAAFGHLARRYDLEHEAIRGLSPHHLPSPKKLMRIAKKLKDRGLLAIFYESTSAPKFIQVLSLETKTATLELHSLGSLPPDRAKRGEDYFSLMKRNLHQLKEGLGCR